MARYYSWCYCFAYYVLLTASTSVFADVTSYSKTWITERSLSGSKLNVKGSYVGESGTVVQKSASFEIDPTRVQIASTIKSRILENTSKGGAWSQTSIDDVLRELQTQKWIIDYPRKKIYKLESTTDGAECYEKNTTGDIVNFTHSLINNTPYACPKPAAIATALVIMQQDSTIKNMTFKAFEDLANTTPNSRAYFTYSDVNGITRNYYIQLSTPKRADQTDKSKQIEISTQELYTITRMFPKAVIDSYLAANEYEKTRNTAYMYMIDRLEGGKFDSNDSTIKPNPVDPSKPYDPNSNPSNGSFSLPSFCDYASVVCDFITWFQKDPDSANDENVQLKDHGKESYNHYWTEYFNVAPACPRPYQIDVLIDLKFAQERFKYDFEYTAVCSWAEQLKPFFLFAAYVACAFIVAGVRNG